MPILRYISFDNSKESDSSVICLGNFDGIHIGHAALVKEALKLSKAKSSQCKIRTCALCFSPFPGDFFLNNSIKHIISDEEKIEIFKEMGLSGVYICEFSEIYRYSPIKFIEEVLIDLCKCVGVVCGFNYRFGFNAVGCPDDLKEYFGNDNFIVVPPVMCNNVVVSSSIIRENIEKGDMELVRNLLGRPFSIYHKVVHGKNLGNKIGFPTLNHTFTKSQVVPQFGIYTTYTKIGEQSYKSVTNVGVCPTVSSNNIVTCETHIIDCPANYNFYGKYAKVYFLVKTRDEKKFNSKDELSNAIANDVKNARKYYNENNYISGDFEYEDF